MNILTDKQYYLDFGPELIKLLGPNMYTNIYYVLGEIIANAYDADANNVYIIYNNEKNRIIVEDDGSGMTYDDFNEKYLRIGAPTRNTELDELTPKYGRKRMGRKGIGKLSALSVSDKVLVMSIKNGEKSGCELSITDIKKTEDRWTVPAIPASKIIFKHIDEKGSGSSITMVNVKHSMNKTIESAKRNIANIFPLISSDFKIHLEDECSNKSISIEDNMTTLVQMSDALITFADDKSTSGLDQQLTQAHNNFDNDRYYKSIEKNNGPIPNKKIFHLNKPPMTQTLNLVNNNGEKKEYELVIKGWIATYATLKDRKKESDFPTNYISLISHGKLGHINIIPEISTNRTYESYVVGQFFIDLLENSDLPDIAASNRQGYKEDDVRYQTTLKLILDNALKPITNLKESAVDVKKSIEIEKKMKEKIANKERMDKTIDNILKNPVIVKAIDDDPDNKIRTQLEEALELKNTVNESYKRVMISHCSDDKELVDELEKILIFSGFTSEEILYTSSTNIESRPDPYDDLYEFLRTFFVDTTKRNNLCVIYIVNSKFISKWNPVLEAGAGWVIRTESFPMYTDEYNSIREPLRKNNQFIPKLSFDMNLMDVQNLASAVKIICKKCQKEEPQLDGLINYIKSTRLYSDC